MKNTYKNCIYKLYFADNEEKCYIGSTKDFKNRYINHLINLLQKTHYNKLLQLDFNKKGVLMLRWEVLEEDIENTKERLRKESEYIRKTKSNKIGYNETIVTVSKNENYVPQSFSQESDMIKEFLERHNITIKYIKGGLFSKDWKNWNYSKKQFSGMSSSEICCFMKKLYSYCMNYIESSHRFVIGITSLDQESILKAIGSDKQLAKMNSFFKKAEKYTKHPINEIVVVSALNPYHLEMSKMTKEELAKYRVSSLVKLLFCMNLSKNITIHVPYKYYEQYESILSV